MLIAATLALACALVAAQSDANIDQKVLRKLITLLDSDGTIDSRDLDLLNRTAHNLGVDKDLVSKLTNLVIEKNGTLRLNDLLDENKGGQGSAYNAYQEDRREENVARAASSPVESPAYASSVVLASDLLSLTGAVANVKEKLCREQGYRFLDGLLLNKRWALKMFDASAKSPQGLLFGSSYHLGNFDECVGIDESGDGGLTVEGQYCLATIQWPEAEEAKQVRTGRGETLRWAVCVPSACDARAVGEFVSTALANIVGHNTSVRVDEKDCYTRRPVTVSHFDIGYLSLILFFVAVIILSSVYEGFSSRSGKTKTSAVHELVLSFSVISNLKKILSTKQGNGLGLDCIAGIKTLAMIFITSGHACLFIASGPVMDAEAWDRLIRHPANAFMLNNTLLVDTFLMLSAFLFCRLLLLELDKRRGRINVFPILVFRYLRVTPAYMVVILFYMTWLPKIGEGPLWEDKLLLEQERCWDSWWANILYINNYVNTDKMCMFQSWYLSVDTQLFFLAPIFIFALWHWKRAGPAIVGVCTIVSICVSAIITFWNRFDPTLLIYAKEFTDITSNLYFKDAYIKTHMKMTPYFSGIITAYILHRIQSSNYQIPKVIKYLAWTSSVVFGTLTTFSVSLFYQEWHPYDPVEAAAYNSLHKLAWGIANGWLIIACATGNGGFMGKFLTWKLWAPLSRLTFCAYLMNGVVELYYVGQLRHPLHITFFTVTANAISHMVLTFFLALLLCLTFESPIHGIEKMLLKLFVPQTSREAVKRDELGESSRNTSQSKLES